MSTKIKSAKIKQDTLVVTYTEHLPGHTSKEINVSSNIPIHEDLRTAFHALDKLMADLCEQPYWAEVPEEDEDAEIPFPNQERPAPKTIVECRGVTIGGSDESEGAVLIGRRELSTGKILNLVSPFQKYEDEDAGISTRDLRWAVGDVMDEVRLWLFEGKRAPAAQGELFNEESQEEDGE